MCHLAVAESTRINQEHTQVAAPQKPNSSANNRNQRDKGGKKEPQIRVNDRIRAPKVRVVTAKGDQLGVMATRDALAKAKEIGLDLVEVAPNADPPVC